MWTVFLTVAWVCGPLLWTALKESRLNLITAKLQLTPPFTCNIGDYLFPHLHSELLLMMHLI